MATRPKDLVTPAEVRIAAALEGLQTNALQSATDSISLDTQGGIRELIRAVRTGVFHDEPQESQEGSIDTIAGGQIRRVSYVELKPSYPSSLGATQSVRRLTSEIPGGVSVSLYFDSPQDRPYAVEAARPDGSRTVLVMQPNGSGILYGPHAPVQLGERR